MSTPYENYPPAGQQWPGQPQQQWPGQPQQQWPGQQPPGQQWPGQPQQSWPGQPQPQQQWPGQPQQQWPGQPEQQWPGQPQQSWPGQQPGYPYGQPARSSRKGLWIGLAIGLVVLLAGGIGAVFLLSGPSSANTPEAAVDRYLSAAKDQNVNDLLDEMCSQLRTTYEKYAKPSGSGSMFGSDSTSKKVESASWDITDTQISGDTATVTVKVSWTEDGKKKNETGKLKVVKESGDWKVCGTST